VKHGTARKSLTVFRQNSKKKGYRRQDSREKKKLGEKLRKKELQNVQGGEKKKIQKPRIKTHQRKA